MIFQVLTDTGINYLLHYFAAYRGERYGPVVGSKAFRTFLVKRKNIAMAPVSRRGRRKKITELLLPAGRPSC